MSAGTWKCFVWKGFCVEETKARWRCCSCIWVAWAHKVTRAKPKYIFCLRNFLTSLFDKHGFHSLFWIYYLSKYNFIWKVSIPGVQLYDMNLCMSIGLHCTKTSFKIEKKSSLLYLVTMCSHIVCVSSRLLKVTKVKIKSFLPSKFAMD